MFLWIKYNGLDLKFNTKYLNQNCLYNPSVCHALLTILKCMSIYISNYLSNKWLQSSILKYLHTINGPNAHGTGLCQPPVAWVVLNGHEPGVSNQKGCNGCYTGIHASSTFAYVIQVKFGVLMLVIKSMMCVQIVEMALYWWQECKIHSPWLYQARCRIHKTS